MIKSKKSPYIGPLFIFLKKKIFFITKKEQKKARQRASLTLRIQSPLRCLTSVFGMGTGVSTVPSSPDFFSKD